MPQLINSAVLLLYRMYNLIQKVYNRTIREYLPNKSRILANVDVHDTPLLDLTANNPLYKIGLILSIYDYISDGDYVEVVGFGRGVTSTHIFWAGASSVKGYEAASNMIEKGIDTVDRNYGTLHELDVMHAVVGDPIDVYGDFSTADIISPSELSDADVLVLDCEGAELSILSNLGTYPKTIICESHPVKGASAEKIIEILSEQYDITIRSHKPARDAKSVVIGTKKRC